MITRKILEYNVAEACDNFYVPNVPYYY